MELGVETVVSAAVEEPGYASPKVRGPLVTSFHRCWLGQWGENSELDRVLLQPRVKLTA